MLKAIWKKYSAKYNEYEDFAKEWNDSNKDSKDPAVQMLRDTIIVWGAACAAAGFVVGWFFG